MKPSRLLAYVAVGASALLVNVAVNLFVTQAYVQKHVPRQTIVSVDAAQTLLKFAQSRPDDLSDAEWADQVVGLNRAIEPAIDALARGNDVVILNSAAVLTGAPDITPQLVSQLLQGAEKGQE